MWHSPQDEETFRSQRLLSDCSYFVLGNLLFQFQRTVSARELATASSHHRSSQIQAIESKHDNRVMEMATVRKITWRKIDYLSVLISTQNIGLNAV